jgi:CRP-like cAMP-binding protein
MGGEDRRTKDNVASNNINSSGKVKIAKMARTIQTFKLAILGPGQLFGDDDVLFDRPHSSTIICRSSSGVLISINGIELIKKMKSNEECWRIF